MRLTTYAIFMFSFMLVLYFLGFTNPLVDFFNNGQGGHELTMICNGEEHGGGQTGADFCKKNGVVNAITDQLTSLSGISLLLGIAATALFSSFIGGFQAIYIIPIFILLVIFNFLIMPFSTMFNTPAIPNYVKLPLFAFFNMITILAIVSFIRGGS